jgi:hypothetical protein
MYASELIMLVMSGLVAIAIEGMRVREVEGLLLRTWLILFIIEKLAMSSLSLEGTMKGEGLDDLDGDDVGEDDERTRNNSESLLTSTMATSPSSSFSTS